ncbi:hypothetical protein OESDEN_22604, partial [Oesophagostomum dentatum]
LFSSFRLIRHSHNNDTINRLFSKYLFSGKAGRPAKSTSTVVLRNRDKTLKSVKAIAKSQGLTPYYKLAQRRAAAIIRSQQPKTKKHAKKFDV